MSGHQAEWINEYVGVPYKPGGATREGYDCWGLVRAVYREQLGIELPDWSWDEPFGLSAKLAAIGAALADVARIGLAHELADAEPYAIALIVQGARPHHVGVAAGAGVLHAERWTGTRYDPMARFRQSYPAVRWWRWPHC